MLAKRAVRLLLIVVGTLVATLAPIGPAAADPYTSPSADPNSADYNPTAWNKLWGATGTPQPTGDIKARLMAMSLLSSAMPEQAGALTSDDVNTLGDAWDKNDLFGKTTDRANLWYARALSDPGNLPPWSPSDSDSVAGDLGAANYGALSPGLKSVVHQIAIIVTGENKPAMPDDAWASWMTPEQRAAYDAQPSQRFDWSKAQLPTTPDSGATIDCALTDFTCLAIKAGTTAAGAVDFVTDPFGWIGAKMAAGTAAIWGWIAGLANSGSAPDLSVDWWINAYQKAMAVGIVLALLVLLWQFIQLSMRRISGPDLLESIILWTPAYLAGIVFGPPLAQFFVHGSTALTDAIVQSFSGFSASATDESMQTAFSAAGSGKAIGGIFVGIFVLIFAVIGAIVLFCSLAIQTLALYLSSALFAVGFAWVISVRHRGGSMKIPFLFLGMLFSRPILFFLLGMGLALTNKAMTFSDESAQNLANLLMAVVAMFIAAFTPLLLMKFAPVSPAGSPATGGAVTAGAVAGGAVVAGSMLTSLATRRAGRQSSGSAARGGAGGAAASGGGAAGSSGPTSPMDSAGGDGASGAQRAAAAGASGPGTARPAGLQRQSAAPGGPPSAHGQRLARDTGQPTVGGTPVRQPTAPSRPAATRPASSRPAVSGAPTPSPAAALSAGGGGSRRSSTIGRAASLGSTARRVGRGGQTAARDVVEGLDGDQRWDSLR